jgi:hypothetical protein
MFCKYCGNQLPEDAKFCPKCGKITEEQEFEANDAFEKQENENSNFYEPEPIILNETRNDVLDQQKDEDAGSILKFAILGLAFSIPVSVLGLIFTIISKSKVKGFIRKYGETSGRATVGKILTIPGMISSIFFMVFWFINIILIFSMLMLI